MDISQHIVLQHDHSRLWFPLVSVHDVCYSSHKLGLLVATQLLACIPISIWGLKCFGKGKGLGISSSAASMITIS